MLIYYMIPFISAIQNRPIIRGSIDFSGRYGVEVGVTTNGWRVYFWSDENVLKLVMEAQLWIY